MHMHNMFCRVGVYDLMDLKIIGGCCGTDGSYIDEIAKRISSLKVSMEVDQ